MSIFTRIRDLLSVTLLRVDDLTGIGSWHRRLRRLYRLIYYTARNVNQNRTFVESAALTLYTMFAMVPLLALTLLILGWVGALEPMIESLYNAFGGWSSLLDRVLDIAATAADNVPEGLFAVVGIGTLLWAIFAVFSSVEASFNHIWGVRQSRGLVRRYMAYLVIAIVVPVLWGLATSYTYDIFAWVGFSREINDVVGRLLSLLIASFSTSLLYKYLPYTAVAWRNALRAGAVAGVALMLWQWGYVFVQGYMTSYNAIYGSFAAIPLFIIWLQTSWTIILFGCELSFVWQNSDRYERIDRRRLRSEPVSDELLRVVVVGSGNVAEAFALTLARKQTIDLKQIYARNPVRGKYIAELAETAWTDDVEELAEADIYLIAVSDRAVYEVAYSLRVPDEAIIVHTAGSVPMSSLPERGGRRGIVYALQSFTEGRRIHLDDVPIFVEAASDATRHRLMHFASLISTQVDYADSERRRTLHLAGVLVNNFVNHLYAEGFDVVTAEGISFDVLKPLIAETAAKAIDSANPHDVQTGPAIRGDRAVCEKHLEMLASKPALRDIYNDLTRRIWEISKRI